MLRKKTSNKNNENYVPFNEPVIRTYFNRTNVSYSNKSNHLKDHKFRVTLKDEILKLQ